MRCLQEWLHFCQIKIRFQTGMTICATMLGVNPTIQRLSLTLRETKKVEKTCAESVLLLKSIEANLYLVSARAFTQSAGEPFSGRNLHIYLGCSRPRSPVLDRLPNRFHLQIQPAEWWDLPPSVLSSSCPGPRPLLPPLWGRVGVLRLAHAIDRSGVREIHRVVRALLHVQQATRRPGLERGVRACWRDDPHPTVEGAQDQVTGKWGRPR